MKKPWLKLYYDDVLGFQMGKLSDASFRLAIQLMSIASQFDDGLSGDLPTLDEIEWVVRTDRAVIDAAMIELENKKFLANVGGKYKIINFRNRQDPDTPAERKQNERMRKNSDVTKRDEGVTGDVTFRDGESELELESELETDREGESELELESELETDREGELESELETDRDKTFDDDDDLSPHFAESFSFLKSIRLGGEKIYQATCKELAALSYATPEYIHAHYQFCREKNKTIAILVTRIKANDPVPIASETLKEKIERTESAMKVFRR